MIGKFTTPTRLCPYCANSIEEHAANCSYCKADLSSEPAPEWLKRDESSSEPRVGSNNKPVISTKFIWPAAVLVVALLAFFAGGYLQRSQQSMLSQAYSKRLQEKDQTIQNQETQLAQTRKQLNESSNQIAEMKAKLDASEKALSATQQRLGAATRETDRRPVAVRRTASRAPDTASSLPPPAVRRPTEQGVYETTRETAVYENPSPTSRVISQIGRGTRINVVNSAGDWLEVRSKHGNPPGYVRSDDARLIGGRTN